MVQTVANITKKRGEERIEENCKTCCSVELLVIMCSLFDCVAMLRGMVGVFTAISSHREKGE